MEAMSNDSFSIMSSPTYPISFRVALVLTVIFLFAGIQLAKRSQTPLLVLTLPLWWSFAATFLGLARNAEALSSSGGGVISSAAGVAEAQLPLKWGLFSIAALCLMFAWRQPQSAVGTAQRWKPRWLILFAISTAALFAANYWLSSKLLGLNAVHAQWKITVAVSLAAIAGVLLLSCIAAAASNMPSTYASRAVTGVAAALAFAAGMVVRHVGIKLQEFISRYVTS